VRCRLPYHDAASEVPVVAGIWGRSPAGEAVPRPFFPEVARPAPLSIARVLLPRSRVKSSGRRYRRRGRQHRGPLASPGWGLGGRNYEPPPVPANGSGPTIV